MDLMISRCPECGGPLEGWAGEHHSVQCSSASGRRYLVVAFDVTGLSDDEVDGLAGEVTVMAEVSDLHPSVDGVVSSIVTEGRDRFVGLLLGANLEVVATVRPISSPVLDLSGEGVIACSSESPSASCSSSSPPA